MIGFFRRNREQLGGASLIDQPLVLLYVEDNPANRQLVQDYSELHAGWHLVWAETGAQGTPASRRFT